MESTQFIQTVRVLAADPKGNEATLVHRVVVPVLLAMVGYKPEEIRLEVHPNGGGKQRMDVLASRGTTELVVEAKAAGEDLRTGKKRGDALRQIRSYIRARRNNGADITGLVTNGLTWIRVGSDGRPGVDIAPSNDEELQDWLKEERNALEPKPDGATETLQTLCQRGPLPNAGTILSKLTRPVTACYFVTTLRREQLGNPTRVPVHPCHEGPLDAWLALVAPVLGRADAGARRADEPAADWQAVPDLCVEAVAAAAEQLVLAHAAHALAAPQRLGAAHRIAAPGGGDLCAEAGGLPVRAAQGRSPGRLVARPLRPEPCPPGQHRAGSRRPRPWPAGALWLVITGPVGYCSAARTTAGWVRRRTSG